MYQIPRRVSGRDGEFDTSARAMYREGVTSSLRADLRIVRGSTIERKQMSTKTTIKRLALVTVAALGLGVLTVAPSSAALQLDSISVSAASAAQTAGETLTASSVVVTATAASIKTETMTVSATIKSGPAYVAPKFVLKETATALTSGTGSSAFTVSGESTTITQATVKYSLYLDAPTVAGTYVVLLTPTGTGASTTTNAVAKEVSIVVSAKVIGWNTAFIKSDTSSAATADVAVSVTSGAKIGSIARITSAHGYGTTASTDTITVAAEALAVVVSTDKGLVSKTNDLTAASKSVTTAAGTAGTNDYYVFANGDVGKATITITVGTRTAVTKTVTFVGPATTLVATAVGTNASWTGITTGTTTHKISATDSAAGATSNPAGLTVVSSDTSVATVTFTSANETLTVVGVKAGTATITVTDPATTSPAKAVSYTVTVKPNKPTTAPTITFDKPSYNVGDVIEMTVNADMADSATAQIFTTALVNSANLTVVPGTTALSTDGKHAIVGGKATYKFYAPAVSGSLTVTGTGGADIDLTTLVTAPVVTATVAIDNPAVAAAELAEAAAQDATDAALEASEDAKLAVELAQQAVDAVADLSAQVTTLIAALKQHQ